MITREHLVLIGARVLRFLEKEELTAELDFSDINNLSNDFKNALKLTVAYNVINGNADNKFDPKGYATRSQAAKILSRLYDIMINE